MLARRVECRMPGINAGRARPFAVSLQTLVRTAGYSPGGYFRSCGRSDSTWGRYCPRLQGVGVSYLGFELNGTFLSSYPLDFHSDRERSDDWGEFCEVNRRRRSRRGIRGNSPQSFDLDLTLDESVFCVNEMLSGLSFPALKVRG